MKYIVFLVLILGLFLNVSSARRSNDLYQVITTHPHELEKITPHLDTIYQNGRLWVVQLKDSAPKTVKEHLRALTGKEKSYLHQSKLITKVNYRNPTPMLKLIESINKDNIQDEVARLASYKTRWAGTSDNQDAVKTLMEKLISYGYDVKKVCYSPDACSVVADKVGTMFPDQVLMVMAHIDSVGMDFAGADDNASGVAVLMEMARVLKSYQSKKTIRFFISNGEERGLLGASHYARKLNNESRLNELAFVVNMDMVGFNSNGIVEIETDAEFENTAKWYADIALRFTNLKPKITIGAFGSDHIVFLRRGIDSLMVIESWDTKNPCYHSECDTPEILNYEYAAEIGKLNLAAILNKDLI